MRFCLCILKSDTVKSDCPMQDLKILYGPLVYFSSLTVCSGDIKSSENEGKKSSVNEEKSSENEKSSGSFSELLFLFSVPFWPLIWKKSRKSANKKIRLNKKILVLPFSVGFTGTISRLQ